MFSEEHIFAKIVDREVVLDLGLQRRHKKLTEMGLWIRNYFHRCRHSIIVGRVLRLGDGHAVATVGRRHAMEVVGAIAATSSLRRCKDATMTTLSHRRAVTLGSGCIGTLAMISRPRNSMLRLGVAMMATSAVATPASIAAAFGAIAGSLGSLLCEMMISIPQMHGELISSPKIRASHDVTYRSLGGRVLGLIRSRIC